MRLVTVVHSIDAVNAGLEERNQFFTTLYYQGVLLYDRNRIPLSTPGEAVIRKSFCDATHRKSALARMFYATACSCASEGRNDVAAFMLHQTAELNCIALLRTLLGYKSTTHSIRKLFALSENISPGLHLIFPGSTKEEREIFDVLHRAYSDVRYKEEYTVSPDKISTLLERVGELLALSSALCQEKRFEGDPAGGHLGVDHDIMPFESICIDTVFDVVLQRGEKESVHIEAKEEIGHIVRTRVDDKRLWITMENNSVEAIPHATIYVTYCKLNGLVVNHSGRVTCAAPVESDWLGIVQNGKGEIALQVAARSLDATLTKSGSLKLSGCADKVTVLNTGSGSIDGIELEASMTKVTIKGSGDVSVHVADELTAQLEGKGRLSVKGQPRLRSLVMGRG
jgi:HEPN domain-containing protein